MPDKAMAEAIQRYAERLRGKTASQPDRDAVAQAVAAVYQELSLASPPVVWCSSPMHFTNMPRLHLILAQPKDSQGVARADLIRTYKRSNKSRKIAGAASFWSEMEQFYASAPQEQRLPGAILSSAITTKLIRKLMIGLYQQVDDAIGLDERQSLEREFNAWFTRPSMMALKRVYGEMGEEHYAREILYERPELGLDDPCSTPDSQSGETVNLRDGTFFGKAWGIWDVMPVMFFDCLRSVVMPQQKLFTEADNRSLDVWVRLFEVAGTYMFFSNFCYACPYPLRWSVDENGRWHNSDGPSAEFSDGQKIYHWHGIQIDEALIMRKGLINPLTIEIERNVERRRIMIEIYGMDKYLRRSFATKIHQDEFGKLYRKRSSSGEEPFVAVELKNSTPEPDGTYKIYVLRVPPTMKTAREAVAWTFGFSAGDYGPAVQT
jgi:hypothetical protein